MNFYIVTFDRRISFSYKKFHESFVSSPKVKRYWHYIQSCYIIGTEGTATELSNHFTECAKAHGLPTTHLVLAVDLQKRQGMLVKDAWEWIRKNTQT